MVVAGALAEEFCHVPLQINITIPFDQNTTESIGKPQSNFL